METATVKRGDTLALLVTRKNIDGTPRTGEASKLKAQIKSSKDILMADFEITETEIPGKYLFVVSATITGSMPLGSYVSDIQYTEDEYVNSCKTFKIIVEKDVTD